MEGLLVALPGFSKCFSMLVFLDTHEPHQGAALCQVLEDLVAQSTRSLALHQPLVFVSYLQLGRTEHSTGLRQKDLRC